MVWYKSCILLSALLICAKFQLTNCIRAVMTSIEIWASGWSARPRRTWRKFTCTLERAEQRIPLPQLAWAILLTKEHLWEFLDREGLYGGAASVFGELELLRLLDQFFDRALYFATEGYEEARPHALV